MSIATVPPAPAAAVGSSATVVVLSQEDAAFVEQCLQCLICETGLGYEDTSLKDRLRVETNKPDYGAIAVLAHDLLRYIAPVALLRGSEPAIKAGAATLALLDEIEADISGEVEGDSSAYKEADWANHERRLSGVRRIRELVASCALILSPAEREIVRVSIVESIYRARPSLDPPPDDERCDEYVEQLQRALAEQSFQAALLAAAERGYLPIADSERVLAVLKIGEGWIEGGVANPDDLNPDDLPSQERRLADCRALIERVATQAGGVR